MIYFEKQAAQGDLLISKVDGLPEGLTQSPSNVVAHSETGHNHVVNSLNALFYSSEDPLVSYVVISEDATLDHERKYDTHESIFIKPGVYRLNRQREYSDESFRRVID